MATILIIEDNALIRTSLRDIVRRQFPSVSVEEARDAKEAMDKVQALRPSFIFMDIKVPGGNGLYLTKNIKAMLPSTTIAMITHYDIPEYRKAALDWGANFFLSKCTLSRKEIVEIIESVVSEKGKDNIARNVLA